MSSQNILQSKSPVISSTSSIPLTQDVEKAPEPPDSLVSSVTIAAIGGQDDLDNAVKSAPKPRPVKLSLQGFIPKAQRPKLEAIYISAITTDGTKEQVCELIEDILVGANLFVRAVRIVSEKGNTKAAKVVVKLNECDTVITKLLEVTNNTLRARRWITDE